VHPQSTAKQPQTPLLEHTEGKGLKNSEEWKLARTRASSKRTVPSMPEVPLRNGFTALRTEEERPVTSGEMLEPSKAAQSACCVTTSTTKNRPWVIQRHPFPKLMHSLKRRASYQGFVSDQRHH